MGQGTRSRGRGQSSRRLVQGRFCAALGLGLGLGLRVGLCGVKLCASGCDGGWGAQADALGEEDGVYLRGVRAWAGEVVGVSVVVEDGEGHRRPGDLDAGKKNISNVLILCLKRALFSMK